MSDPPADEGLYVADKLPLEYPPREALRIYWMRLLFLLIVLGGIVCAMVVLYALVISLRDLKGAGILMLLVGAAGGYLTRLWREGAIRPRDFWKRLTSAALDGPQSRGTPRHHPG